MDKDQAILAMGALAQMTRFEAFQQLVKHEPHGIAAGELARLLSVPQNTLSTHLNVLTGANLVTRERQSRSIIYRAQPDRLEILLQFLLQDCCLGRPDICARKTESKARRAPAKTRGR